MKFDKAKIALRDAALRVGSELFTQEALLQIGRIQADAGVDGAQKELDLANFVSKLFNSGEIKDSKNSEFWEMIAAIGVLDQYEKNHNKANSADAELLARLIGNVSCQKRKTYYENKIPRNTRKEVG